MSESSESLYFSAADIVWVAYPNFQLMSSVLVKAAQAETNILYYDKGLISYFANKYGNTLQDNTFFMKKGFILNSDEAVLKGLVEKGVNTIFGARGISRVRREEIENQIADLIMNNSFKRGTRFEISYLNHKFTITSIG